jgi:phage terminase large subunit
LPIELILQPKQLELGKLIYKTGPDAPTWIGGGGARAGGKSGGLRRIMLDRRQNRPGTAGVILRRTYKDVNENHIQKYQSEFPELMQYWRATDLEFRFPNGSRLCFRHADNQQAVDQAFWGPEWYDIFVDQAEQFSEHELTIIKSSNRWAGAPENDCKTALFFNPGGVGTEFLRRIFHQKRFHGGEKSKDYAFVHLFGWDNFVWFETLGLTPKQFYAIQGMCKADEERPDSMCCRFHMFVNLTAEGRKLNALPQSLRAGHLLGSFDSFAGQYFAGVWDESKLILTAQQEAKLIQPWWQRWMGHDDGFVHHAAVGWATGGKVAPKLFHEVFGVVIDEPVEVWIVYRDVAQQETEQGELVRQCVRQMDEQEKKQTKRYFLSVDAWEKDSKGHSTADTINQELRLAGLPWAEQAANGRIGGWRFMYAMMKKTSDVLAGKMAPTRLEDDFETEAGGYSLKTPLIFICSRCTDTIESIPMLIRDTKHPGRAEDVWKQPTKSDDVGDMVRYLVYSMHSAKMEAPLSVKAQEYYDSLGDVSMQSKGMAMLRFDAEHKKRRGSAWSGRQ